MDTALSIKQQNPLKYLLIFILFLIGIGITYFGISSAGQIIYILPAIVFLIIAILSAIAFNGGRPVGKISYPAAREVQGSRRSRDLLY